MTKRLSPKLHSSLLKISEGSSSESASINSEVCDLLSEGYIAYNVFAGWVLTDKGRAYLHEITCGLELHV